MKTEYVWVDRNRNHYKLEDISNSYLLNIIKFICDGGGFTDEMSERKIKMLFDEAKKRNLQHKFQLEKAISAYHEKLSYECQVFCPDWE